MYWFLIWNRTVRILTGIFMDENKHFSMIRVMMITNIVVAAAIVITLVILVPRTVSVLDEAQKTLVEVQDLSANAQESLDGIDEIMENVSGFNAETLEQAVRDLADTIEPLIKLSDLFG